MALVARRRHLDALDKAEKHLHSAQQVLLTGTLELVAEDLVQAQHSLGELPASLPRMIY